MRHKDEWGNSAILADIINRLGQELSKKGLWEKYVFICETTGPGCELAEKAADPLFIDEDIECIIKELGRYYVTKR